MNFVRLIPKRPVHLKILSPFTSLVMGRCSDQILDNDSSLDVRLFCSKQILSFNKPHISVIKRFKYKKTIKEEESKAELSDDDDDDEDFGDSKLIVGHVLSLRTDAILKTGLGLARNKIETYFYESKIRVNGKKILKKSQKVSDSNCYSVIS
ncbi:mitochondrial transcription rescue factor 1 [Halyomorpha halys]|uniref:mitochondrial transcription rescue factor 1 n=1 Tax=Halyomorpha halys TaxID=286706 RepID=UPI0006D519B4